MDETSTDGAPETEQPLTPPAADAPPAGEFAIDDAAVAQAPASPPAPVEDAPSAGADPAPPEDPLAVLARHALEATIAGEHNVAGRLHRLHTILSESIAQMRHIDPNGLPDPVLRWFGHMLKKED